MQGGGDDGGGDPLGGFSNSGIRQTHDGDGGFVRATGIDLDLDLLGIDPTQSC